MTMLSVILPMSTLAGKECIDLTALDYDNVALFDHHAHFLEKRTRHRTRFSRHGSSASSARLALSPHAHFSSC